MSRAPAVTTVDSLNRLQRRLQDIPDLSALGFEDYLPTGIEIDAVITSNADLGTTGVRWQYAWHMLKLTGANFDTIADPANGYSGTTSSNFAINRREIPNQAEPGDSDPWILAGVDAHGSSYPAGFALRPVGGGGTDNTHKQDTPVRLRLYQTADNQLVWMFSELNTHDGTCTGGS